MTNKEESQLVVTDLPIALYLNQQVTFDILAALEDGFSRFSTVQTTSSGEKSTEVSGEAQVGANLTLFGMKFGGRGSRQTGQAQSESTTEEIIHTPASSSVVRWVVADGAVRPGVEWLAAGPRRG